MNHDYVTRRLGELERGEGDYTGLQVPSPAAIARAYDFASTLTDTLPTPSIVPSEDGPVRFVWLTGGLNVEVEISDTGTDVWAARTKPDEIIAIGPVERAWSTVADALAQSVRAPIAQEAMADAQPDDQQAPGWHRLAREASHRAEGHWIASRGGILLVAVTASTNTYSAVAHLAVTSASWQRLATVTAVTAVAFIQHRRWQARADWLAATPRWWERSDEMPTILPFPRISRWATSRTDVLNARLARSWPVRVLERRTATRQGRRSRPPAPAHLEPTTNTRSTQP